MTDTVISIAIPTEVDQQLCNLAEQEDRTPEMQARYILRTYFASNPQTVPPTKWELYLSEVPQQAKITTIKEVRTITSFGLKESKDLVDSVQGTPVLISTFHHEGAANDALKLIQSAGATAYLIGS